MTLKPGEQIGEEIHQDIDQFFRFEEGEGKVIIDGKENVVKDGSGVIVPAGSKHNVINTGKGNLKLYSLYAPPKHEDGINRKEKSDTLNDKEKFTGKTTE
jgi:mannose-6-phosphate isomerase-like protein (cupin superfamily)